MILIRQGKRRCHLVILAASKYLKNKYTSIFPIYALKYSEKKYLRVKAWYDV